MQSDFSLARPAGPRQTFGAGLATLGMIAVVGGALLFQHVGGYIPCALCLEQRTPYYIAIPIGVVAFFLSQAAPAWLVRLLLATVGALMLYAAFLGALHAGVEWGWWPGSTDCAAVGGFEMGGDLLAQLDTVRPPACEEPALLVFGLSLAAWNALLATLIAAVALRAAFAAADRFSVDD